MVDLGRVHSSMLEHLTINALNLNMNVYAVKREQWSTSWWEQFRVLLSRGLKERRYEAFNKLRIFQVLSVATVGGLLWWQTPPSHIQDRVIN